MKKRPAAVAPPRTAAQVAKDVEAGLAWLKAKSSAKVRDGLARYGIPSDRALGVSMKQVQELARQLGRDQALAEAFWATGVYEARLLTAYLGEPEKLTPKLLDAWCRDFDNWAVVDTLCFVLLDRSPVSWGKVVPWTRRRDEFQRRAGFVLIACLAAHDETATDDQFLELLPVIESGATDERNFVKKGVSWALRMAGRRSMTLNTAALSVARRLATSGELAARWIGKGAIKELTQPAVLKRIAARDAAR